MIDAARLARMNTAADDIVNQSPTTRLGDFLFAMHGVAPADYGDELPPTLAVYSRQEILFSGFSLFSAFGELAVESGTLPPRVNMLRANLHEGIKWLTTLRYEIVQNAESQQYIGRLIVPVWQTEFDPDAGSSPVVAKMNIVVGAISRQFDAVVPHELELTEFAFGDDLLKRIENGFRYFRAKRLLEKALLRLQEHDEQHG